MLAIALRDAPRSIGLGFLTFALCALSSLMCAAAQEGTVIAKDDIGVQDQQDWRLVGSGWAAEGIKKEGRRLIAMDKGRDDAKSLWWFTAPKDFLGGDAAHAYNGWLQYTLGHFEYEDIGEGVMDGYDVMLISTRKKFSMGIKGVFKAPDDQLSATYQVRLDETFSPDEGNSYWELITGKLAGVRASKLEVVQCLSNLAEVRIRGSYFKGLEATWLREVSVLQGLLDKGGRYPGMTRSGEPDGGPEYTVINGVKVYAPRIKAPASDGCCASKTCTGQDRYELVFDRPGCMNTADDYCEASYKTSNAATIVEGSDLNEGRVFFTPETPIRCSTPEATRTSSLCTDGLWGVGTKNQNIGQLAVPIAKPFSQDFYLNSVPLICSPATLTVTVHGDIRYAGDSILVYGEDGAYLGALFAGNLTYMEEGQRPYPVTPDKPHTKCAGRAVRGGWKPDAAGNQACDDWEPGEAQESSSQTSEALPYRDSLVIPAAAMLRYSSDEQVRLTFVSNRLQGLANTFSGTGGAAPTEKCLKDPKSAGCLLNGRVIFRALRMSFSPGVCVSKKVATDVLQSVPISRHNAQPLSLPYTFRVPSGSGGVPSGNGTLTVVANVHMTEDQDLPGHSPTIEVLACPSASAIAAVAGGESGGAEDHACVWLGSIFGSHQLHGKRSTYSSNPMMPTLQYDQRANHTGTLSISREVLANLTSSGLLHLILRSNSTGGPMGGDTPYSGGSDVAMDVKLSPVTLTYPLMACYLRSITSGPNLKIFLERPRSYYFSEAKLPIAAGDVTFTIASKWGFHSRYSGDSSCTIDSGSACAGNVDGMPKLRVDKDTIDDLGNVAVWTEVVDGQKRECCPNDEATSITDTLWLKTGQLAGCVTGITLSAVGGGGSGYAATVTEASNGEISRVTITNPGTGYTADPQLVASSAACTCTPQIWTCSSTSRDPQAGSDGTTYTSAGACAGACFNVDGTAGSCCVPGSTRGSDGGIPVCNPPQSLPGNVAGNLDTCIRPVRSGCQGLPVCSNAATSSNVNTIRRQYPEMIDQHRQWPHGFSYLQLRAGNDGEFLGNLFLKDYSQYSPHSYYIDTLVIPRAVFERSKTQDGTFEFTIATPPGRDGLEIAGITLGYPVLKAEDAQVSSNGRPVDLTDPSTVHTHGPAPSYSDAVWSGQGDADMVTQSTKPYFQQQYFKGTV